MRPRPDARRCEVTAAFDAVFAVFVLAMVVVAFLAVRWAVGRDRVARAQQQPRHGAEEQGRLDDGGGVGGDGDGLTTGGPR